MAAMKFRWRRPPCIPYPIVWDTFAAKDAGNGDKMLEFEIRDLLPDKFDDAFQLMANDFLRNEPMSQYYGKKYFIIYRV